MRNELICLAAAALSAAACGSSGSTGTGDCSPACGVGFQCSNKTCVVVKTGKIGSACSANADCPSASCDVSATDGYCTSNCSGQVQTGAALCPSNALCTKVSEVTSLCLATCGASSPCRSGYICVDAGPASVCIPGCTKDADCALGTGCNVSTGQCDAAHAPPGKVGAPCTANAGCATSACDTDPVFPGGYCIDQCTAAQAATNESCDGTDGVCVGFPDTTTGGEVDVCFRACTTSVDCRPEYTCTASAGIRNAAGLGICVPRCGANFACDTGYACDPALGLCQPSSSGPAQVRHLSLGQVQAGTTFSTLGQVSLTLGSEDTGFSLVLAPDDLVTVPLIVKITAPSGAVVFDIQNPNDATLRLLPVATGVQGFLLPNSPRVTPEVGTYTFDLGCDRKPVALTVDAFVRSGVPSGGSLPVNFWFFKGQGPTAASAANDPKLTQAVALWKNVYGAQGITLDPVTLNDVPPPFDTQLATITDQDAQEPGLMQVAQDKAGLNIFFVDQITAPGLKPGQVLLGSSRGIPGAHSFTGLGHSGIVFNYLAIDTAEQLGHVMAHEGGHYLGLFHTTEQPGTSFDPLQDTPECPASRDANGDGVVSAGECVGFGADNMMFWQDASGSITQNTVSAEQRFVLLHNTMVQ